VSWPVVHAAGQLLFSVQPKHLTGVAARTDLIWRTFHDPLGLPSLPQTHISVNSFQLFASAFKLSGFGMQSTRIWGCGRKDVEVFARVY
jgi:hypothetical protein